jgi:hypothetical protein
MGYGGKEHGRLGLKETSRLKASTNDNLCSQYDREWSIAAGLALEFMLKRPTVK